MLELIKGLKFVLIEEELTKCRSGASHIDNTLDARRDKGFHPQAQEGSLQVELEWAAIYIGKTYPRDLRRPSRLLTEVMGPLTQDGKLNSADILLWSIGD